MVSAFLNCKHRDEMKYRNVVTFCSIAIIICGGIGYYFCNPSKILSNERIITSTVNIRDIDIC